MKKMHLTYVGVAAREGNIFFLKKAIEWGADVSEIKELDLSGRQMKELPDFPWEKLENLKILDLEGNNLDLIPAALTYLPLLEKVVCTPPLPFPSLPIFSPFLASFPSCFPFLFPPLSTLPFFPSSFKQQGIYFSCFHFLPSSLLNLPLSFFSYPLSLLFLSFVCFFLFFWLISIFLASCLLLPLFLLSFSPPSLLLLPFLPPFCLLLSFHN